MCTKAHLFFKMINPEYSKDDIQVDIQVDKIALEKFVSACIISKVLTPSK